MRVRFAPSPTGALHIGGARTALYNWLLARGRAKLRGSGRARWCCGSKIPIVERSTPENVAQILDALRWLRLNWDEGPVFQSQRTERHREVLQQLIDGGHAYHSSATADHVRAYKRRHGPERGFRGEPESSGAIRLRVPDTGETVVDDVIIGETRFPNASLDDLVIARADGTPVYNFAVAVDDLDAEITDVVRGIDHLPNTPKQLLVFDALGAPAPRYAHLPLLHGPDGKKLSKRHGAASVQELRDAGYIPEAVVNYIALLGAGFAADEEHFSMDELAERFRLERVSKNPAIFDERKLRHINGRWLRELSTDDLVAGLEEYTGRSGIRGAVEIAAEKIQTLADFWPLVSFLFEGPADDQAAFERVICRDGGVETLTEAREALARAEPFTVQNVEQALRGLVERRGCKPGQVFQPVRVAIAGTTVSPGIFESVALLGREGTLARIDQAIERAISKEAKASSDGRR